jgi:tetratricopeptide (TPR) repeat protein
MSERSLREYLDLAKQYIASESYPQAIDVLRHVLHYYPKAIEGYVLLGQACLEHGDVREAVELFQRALSADPENITAWIGLASAYEHDGLQDLTIWHLERAFELDPTHSGLRKMLQEFYMQRHNIKELRVKLNSAALGRVYLRGGLYQQAISELRAVMNQPPQRPYIKTALATAYWNMGQRVEAANLCLELLEQLPNCLQANLILGEIWSAGDRADEGRERLHLAQALDPENRVAQQIFGYRSPLAPASPMLPPLGQLPAEEMILPAPPVSEMAPTLTRSTSPTPDENLLPSDVVPAWSSAQTPAVVVAPGEVDVVAEAPASPAVVQPAPESAEVAPPPAGETPPVADLVAELPPDLRALVEEALASETHIAPAPPAETAAAPASEPTAAPPQAWETAGEELPPDLRQLVEETIAAEEAGQPTMELLRPATGEEAIAAEEESALQPPAEPAVAPAETEDLASLVAQLPPELRALTEEAIAAEPAAAPSASAAGEAAAQAAPEEPEPEIPDWLRALAEKQPQAGAPAIEEEEEEEESAEAVPDWLANLVTSQPETPPAPKTPALLMPEAVNLEALETGERQLETPAWSEIATALPTAGETGTPTPVEASAGETSALSEAMMEEMLASEAISTPPAAPEPIAPAGETVRPPAEEEPSPFVRQALERLAVRPDDHETRLALARSWRDAGKLDAAVADYDVLIKANQYVDSIVADLEKLVIDYMSHHDLWILLGDAYMRQGRLSDALNAYRSALGR